MLIFEVLLPSREPLVATFNETFAVTSSKNIIKQGKKISKVWEKPNEKNALLSLCFKNSLKNVNFGRGFLPLKWSMLATFSETNAVTFKKFVVKQVINSESFKNSELTC